MPKINPAYKWLFLILFFILSLEIDLIFLIPAIVIGDWIALKWLFRQWPDDRYLVNQKERQ